MSITLGIRSGLLSGLRSGLNPGANLLFLIWGQSNARGRADQADLSDASLADPYPAVQLRHKCSDAADDPVGWDDLGTFDLEPYAAAAMGCELSLGRDLDALYPDQVSLMKMAIDASAIGDGQAGSHWHPTAVYPTIGANVTSQFVTLAQQTAAARSASIAAIYAQQGEQDAAVEVFAPAYADNKTDWLDEVRGEFGNIPLIFTRLHSGGDAAFLTTVRSQQAIFAARTPNVYMVDIDDLVLFDSRHLDADSQVTVGERFAAAYAAMVNRTTLAVSITESADPVDAGSEYSYTIVVTNAGTAAAVNVGVTIQLPAGSSYVSSSGTGWTLTHVSGLVTATRASGSIGAMPTITVTLDAQGSEGDAVATARAVASNVLNATTDSETTTINPGATWTVDNGYAFPADSTEWGALMSAASAGGSPVHCHLCQEASGDLADSIGSWTLADGGTVSYQQAVTGFTRKAVKFGGSVGDEFSGAGGPNPASTSVLELVILELGAAPGAEVALFGLATGFYVTHHTSGIPRAFIGGSGGGNLGSSATGFQVLALRHNRTAGTATLFNAAIKASQTYDSGSVGTVTGGLGTVDGTGFNSSSTVKILMHAVWSGAAAEKTDQQVFDLLTEMGFSPGWSP